MLFQQQPLRSFHYSQQVFGTLVSSSCSCCRCDRIECTKYLTSRHDHCIRYIFFLSMFLVAVTLKRELPLSCVWPLQLLGWHVCDAPFELMAGYTTNEAAGAAAVLFLFYGPAVAPFTYCIRSAVVMLCRVFFSSKQVGNIPGRRTHLRVWSMV